jgi:uncharacterized protein
MLTERAFRAVGEHPRQVGQLRVPVPGDKPLQVVPPAPPAPLADNLKRSARTSDKVTAPSRGIVDPLLSGQLYPPRRQRSVIAVRITFDADKRAAVLEQRGIDMLDAVKIFAGPTATWLDDRRDYGEARQLTAGFLAGRVVLIAWTQRSGTRRVIGRPRRITRSPMRSSASESEKND